MKEADLILGLFYSDENNLIFDNIKFSEMLTEENKNHINMLPYKFLGPLFLTAASSEESWRIGFIELSLSLRTERTYDIDIIQSFFSLNSSIESEEGLLTHLFALIGSPHTEDVKILHDKLIKFIHPSIIQGKIVSESILGSDFKFRQFINEELNRGLNLIEYSLGSARKMYRKEQQNYYCVGLIERTISKDSKTIYLYTFDKDDPLRKHALSLIPSYYIMVILADYYENLVEETLNAFGKTSVYPNIRTIRLHYKEKHAFYKEEFNVENNIKKSYGVILVPESMDVEEAHNLSFYKRNLRFILDGNKGLTEIMRSINPHFKFEKWCTATDEDLNKIRQCFDD